MSIADLVSWRRKLHAAPEFGFALERTAAFTAEKLAQFGLEVHSGIGRTGVVAVLKKGQGGPRIGLRADMDALQISEKNQFDYASRHAGHMHACGHDGHTAMLLGAAQSLTHEVDFQGEVVFIFQPAEEHGLGARAMIADGLFDRFAIDEVYALHNMPGIPAGVFATRAGPIMASEDNFEITLEGKGGHAARPHMTNEALISACHLVTQLQTVVARRTDPLANAVVSVTEILTDGARNVLPGRATVRGDTRSYTDEVQALVEQSMRRISAGVAKSFDQELSFQYSYEFAATVNTKAEAGYSSAAAGAVKGLEVWSECEPLMASDDFGLMLRHRPGAYSFIGNGVEGGKGGAPLHNAHYDFNDDILHLGRDFFIELVRQRSAAV